MKYKDYWHMTTLKLTPEQQELFNTNLEFFSKLIDEGRYALVEPEVVKAALQNFSKGKILPEEEKYILLFFDALYRTFSFPFSENKFADKANCHRMLYVLYPILEWVLKKYEK